MPATVGRTTILYWGESPQTAVAGVREKSVTMSGEAVDVTNDDSAGWRELLDAPQVNQVEISVSGVLLNDTLRSDWINGGTIDSATRMREATWRYDDGGEIRGTFYMQEYSETGNHDGEMTFEATFQSTGEVQYVPA